MIVLERETPMNEKIPRRHVTRSKQPVRCNTLTTRAKVNRNTIRGSKRLLLLSPNKGELNCYITGDRIMTGCNESQGNESTKPSGGANSTVNPVTSSVVVVAAATEQVSEPMCTPECGSMAELINTTVDQLCFVDQDDSCGPREAHVTSRARMHNSASISPQPSKNTAGWEKRGRFTIWPVSLGD